MTEDIKDKLSSGLQRVSNSEIINKVKTEVIVKKDQVSSYVSTQITLSNSEQQQRIDLQKFLEENSLKEEQQDQNKATFVINDEDETDNINI